MGKEQANEKKQGFVEHITPRDVDFSQWYTDVILKSELVDYAPVRGCMVMRPYGYAIWERIQAEMDRRFKEKGHENVYMPMLIPESLLLKEAEHVEGFAPEVAWVTQGGNEVLTERLAIRPTSETIFCAMYSKWVSSWRDLPMKYNQWCSVMRWEKSTRPFLRTSEFLWQEGHTIHETAEEAQAETMEMLEVYREVAENILAMPVLVGQKTEKEKFAGARATYSMEAMMQDGKALQAGTSHNFGTNFAEAYDIQFLNREGKLTYVHETSWGVSTRLIGAIIMTHGDERGLKLPPHIAPIQVVIVPIAAHKGGVMEKCEALFTELKAAGLRVKLDDRDTLSPGFKFNDWELKGVPVRIEIGPRDLENGQCVVFRRDTYEKQNVALCELVSMLSALLEDIQHTMFEIANKFRQERITEVHNLDELKKATENGFAKAMWCGDRACEDQIKEEAGASSRNMPFDQTPIDEHCVCCGKKASKLIYFAKAY
ncbi:MAG: proline--tRNA ligase [Clostridia bacterium]